MLTGALALTAAAIVAAIAAIVINDRTPQAESDGPGTAFQTACGGVASNQIQLDQQYVDPAAVVCFEVEHEVTITIGATSTAGLDLKLEVETSTGGFWAAADDTYGSDPEVSTIFLPGSYVVSVSQFGGGDPGSFTLLTTTSPSPYASDDGSGAGSDEVPSIESCGVGGVELIDGTGQMAVSDDARFACVLLTADAFVKFGAQGEASSTSDLTLAVYAFDNSGAPVFVHSVDNTFDLDPEFSIDLPAGMYVVEVAEKTGGGVGESSLYIDNSPSDFRIGAVSEDNSDFTAGQCGTEIPVTLAVGDHHAFVGGARVRACMTLSAQQRLTIEVSSQNTQDLVLEIIGFMPDGTPVRYGWNDDDLFSNAPTDVNPKLDMVLPAGTYLLAVDEFGGSTLAHDATISLSAP